MKSSWSRGLPSGNLLHSYGKSPCQWVNQRTKWAIFNSFLYVYQGVVLREYHGFLQAEKSRSFRSTFVQSVHLLLGHGPSHWQSILGQPDVFGCFWIQGPRKSWVTVTPQKCVLIRLIRGKTPSIQHPSRQHPGLTTAWPHPPSDFM